jgi:hypothetical protein
VSQTVLRKDHSVRFFFTPASDGLFNEGQGKKLNQERADAYHTVVAKALFLCKRARPDMQPTITDPMVVLPSLEARLNI